MKLTIINSLLAPADEDSHHLMVIFNQTYTTGFFATHFDHQHLILSLCLHHHRLFRLPQETSEKIRKLAIKGWQRSRRSEANRTNARVRCSYVRAAKSIRPWACPERDTILRPSALSLFQTRQAFSLWFPIWQLLEVRPLCFRELLYLYISQLTVVLLEHPRGTISSLGSRRNSLTLPETPSSQCSKFSHPESSASSEASSSPEHSPGNSNIISPISSSSSASSLGCHPFAQGSITLPPSMPWQRHSRHENVSLLSLSRWALSSILPILSLLAFWHHLPTKHQAPLPSHPISAAGESWLDQDFTIIRG